MADLTNFTITPKLEARFWAKVDRRGSDECWLWTGTTDSNGYPCLTIEYRTRKVTHLALHLSGRRRPIGLYALHSCDKPRCVNPGHLRWGTAKENAQDRRIRQRAAIGASNGQAKLSELAAAHIKMSREKRAILAARYGVSAETISRVRLGKQWFHIPNENAGRRSQ